MLKSHEISWYPSLMVNHKFSGNPRDGIPAKFHILTPTWISPTRAWINKVTPSLHKHWNTRHTSNASRICRTFLQYTLSLCESSLSMCVYQAIHPVTRPWVDGSSQTAGDPGSIGSVQELLYQIAGGRDWVMVVEPGGKVGAVCNRQNGGFLKVPQVRWMERENAIRIRMMTGATPILGSHQMGLNQQ